MREVFFIIGKDDIVLHEEASTSPIALPDARSRWERIWELRDEIVELSHSHPLGPLGFSDVDESTMAALESALGKKIVFSVVAPEATVRRDLDGKTSIVAVEPPWAARMRELSGMVRGLKGFEQS